MRIKRSFNPEIVNSIVRHPDVFSFVKDDSITEPKDFDCTGILSDSRNISLLVIDDSGEAQGVFILIAINDSTFEVHTNLLSSCRGADAIAAANMASEFMFISTPCARIVTRVPEFNRAALSFSKKNGFQVDYIRDKSFLYGGSLISQTYLSLDIYSWMRIVSLGFQGVGKRFHDNLEALKVDTGIGGDIHADDDAHDAAVGISISMMLSGMISKSEYYFNEWAAISGYAPAKHLGIDRDGNHIINITEAVIALDSSLNVKEA